MSLEDIADKAVEKGIETALEKTLGIKDLKTMRAVAETGAAAGAAVSAATGLSVAATSGAGITSGLAAAGGVVGGGMARSCGIGSRSSLCRGKNNE